MSNSNAARSRRWRQRRRDGLVLLPVLVDEIAVEVLLCHHGLVPSCGAKDQEALRRALEELLKRLIAADAAQHNG